MSRVTDALLTGLAILVGVSPLLWVTRQEYGVQSEALQAFEQRERLLERTWRLIDRGEVDEAVTGLVEAAEAHPGDPAYRSAVETLLLRSGHLIRSREQLERIRALGERAAGGG